MRYDVMIIGGGPGGYTAAHKAAKNGLSVLLFEKDKIGGTCLNRGCIPTKALIEASRLYRDAKEGEVLGITGDVGFDFELVNARRDEIVEKLRSGVEKMLKADKVEVINGEAKIVAKDQIECAGRIYEGENIIIASGSVTSIPPIEGIEEAITSDTILEEAFDLPESMIIIGGGVIGSEIADALNGFGSKITIIEMADRLIPTMDKDLGQRLGMFFKKKGIDVFLNAAVKKIEKTAEGKKVLYSDKNGQECEVCAKEVLVATGRRAAVQGLVKEGLDLKIERGVTADATGKTNIDNIYVIGDAKAGNIQLAHVASAQGENVIDTILKQKEKI
ncbi:MAG: FAD-dependent oxidoreductase, partial [Erysipelotrichaceae bacterium]|nr:FAD-dependent oxidoreductase [Erysipelotrichaceae bacterium]